MAPYYQGYDPEFVLTDDDIAAIQSLYGSKPSGGGVQPQPTEKPTTTTTTTRPTTTTTTTTQAPDVVTQSTGPPNSCSVIFKAITQIHENSILVFNGEWLWRLTDEGLQPGYPIRTRDWYQSAPTNIDAAIYSRKTYYTYFFSGKMVWQYYGFQLIKTHSIATQSFTGSVSDIVTDANGNFYLIKGSDCWAFDESHVMVVSPPRQCSQIFPGMSTSVDSIVQLVNDQNNMYLFNGQNYSKYNINTARVEKGYPKAKAGPWMGVACGGVAYPPK